VARTRRAARCEARAAQSRKNTNTLSQFVLISFVTKYPLGL
jgi:hypothetical protein